ncbi:T9SS type A sorting domain-containing protein [bacterium]|nr:T9SS type A sorting domain-containing protein [bacterium]
MILSVYTSFYLIHYKLFFKYEPERLYFIVIIFITILHYVQHFNLYAWLFAMLTINSFSSMTTTYLTHAGKCIAISLFLIFVSSLAASAQTTSWTGTTNKKWSNSNNWTNGSPDENTHAIIGDANFTGSNQPELDGSTAKCLSLTIGNGTKTSSLDIEKNLQVGGDILIGANGTINADKNNRTITLEGNWTNNGTYSATTSSAGVTFAGTTQTITGATTFEDLTINSGTTVILASDITVDDDLEVSGVLNPTAAYEVSGSGTLSVERNGEIQVYAQNFSSNYSISNIDIDDRSTVNYASASTLQYIDANLEYGYLQISGGSTKELTADLPDLQDNRSTSGRLIIDAGILDLKTYTADRQNGTGGDVIISNDAQLWIGGTNSFPANYDNITISSTSTVIYYGNNQTVIDADYGNLILSGTSGSVTKTLPATALVISGAFSIELNNADDVTVTAASDITVGGDFSIESDCEFDASSYSHTFNSEYINDGTFTGNTSTVSFGGVGASISGGGIHEFNNVVITVAGVYVLSSADIEIQGDLSTTGSGSFRHEFGGLTTFSGSNNDISGDGISFADLEIIGTIATAEDITVIGDFLVDGTFTATNNAVTMTGSGAVIEGSGTLTFNGLNVTGTISAAMDFSVTSNFAVSNTGSFDASSGDVTFDGTSDLSGEATFYDISISSGNTLRMGSNSIMNIDNSFTNNGTFNTSSLIPSTVRYTKNGAQDIEAVSYYNLELSTGGTKSLTGSTTVSNDITINTGVTLSAGSNTLEVYRHWNNAGSFTQGTSDVQFRGSNTAIITGATTFNTITINKSSSDVLVSLENDVEASSIVMTQGYINTGVNEITTTGTRTGNGIIIGAITHDHSFSGSTPYYFEGPNNSITFFNPSGLSTVTVTTTLGEVTNVDPTEESVTRSYDIDIPTGTYDSATLRLHYEDNELNAFVEPFLAIFKYNSGTTWDSLGVDSRDLTDNYVQLGRIADVDGEFMLSGLRNIVRWNGSVSSAWDNASNWTTISGLSMSNRVPDSNDVAQIGQATFTNQPTINSNEKINVLRFGSAQAATLTISSGSLEVVGSARGNWSTNRSHVINVGANELTIGTTLTLGNGLNNQDIELAISTGTVNIGYDLVHKGTGAVTFSGAGDLRITHDYIYTAGDFTASTGTVTYTGGINQTIASIDYYNLEVDKTTGRARITEATEVSNDFTTATGGQTAVLDSFTVNGNINIGSSTEFLEFNSDIFVGGDWTNNGTFTVTGGTVHFNGSSDQDVDATTFNNLNVDKSGGALNLTDDLIINNNLSLVNGTLDVGTYQASRATPGGNLSLSSGSELRVAGTNNFPANFLVTNINAASTVTYDGTVDQVVLDVDYGHLNFSNGSPNEKTVEGSITVNGDLTINSGAVLNPDTTTITLLGDFMNSGTISSSQSTFILNGSSKDFTGTTTLNNLSVISGDYTVTTGTITIEGNLFIENTGSLDFGSNTVSLDGNLTNRGSLTSNGIATFTGTRVQEISLQTAITSTSSGIINFNGTVSPNINSSSAPTFATVNINNTGGISPSQSWTIYGDFNIGSGATFNAGALTHNFYGDFDNQGSIYSSGKLNFVPGSPYSSAVTITMDGDSFNSSGEVEFGGSAEITLAQTNPVLATVTISNTNSAGVEATGDWSIADNLEISSGAEFKAGTTTTHSITGDLVNNGTLSGQTSLIIFVGDTSSIAGVGTNNFEDLTIDTNTYLTLNNEINILRNFLLHGTLNAPGRTISFTGNTEGSIGGAVDTVYFEDLRVNKSGNTATLDKPVIVTGNLLLTNGTFSSDATNVLIIADNALADSGNASSFVEGPIMKVGDDAFVFPTGKDGKWARIGISAPSSTTDAFTAEFFSTAYANTSTMATNPTPALNNVSTLEYWTCDRTIGSSDVTVSLYWENSGNSGITSFSSDLVVARWNGSAWENAGQSAIVSASPGNVTSNTVSSFSPFTFGSLSGAVNPVPVELLSFDAELQDNNTVQLKWTTANEINNDYFTIERSIDLVHWEEVVIIDGAGNSNELIDYLAIDPQPYQGVSYYRLKQTDFDGTTSYSENEIIDRRAGLPSISIAPNPSKQIVNIEFSKEVSGEYRLMNYTGTVSINSHFNGETIKVDMQDLPSGVYFLEMIISGQKVTRKIVKL